MIANIVSLLVLVVLAVLLAWLARRAWRAGPAVVRWPGAILAGLLSLLLLSLSVVAVIGLYRLNARAGNPVLDVTVQGTPEQIALGERYANVCTGCHASSGKLPLDGGSEDFLAGPGSPPTGSLWAPNLTPGGELREWSDGEIIRAIREGVSREGRPLIIMPAQYYHKLSDEHVQAIVAYLRAQPAVDRPIPERRINLLGAVFIGGGLFPTSVQPAIAEPVQAPAAGVTPEYGQYLVESIGGCQECHGADLTGGTNQFLPKGPNLREIVPNWTDAGFINFIRTGVDPTGDRVDTEQMPIDDFAPTFTDEELRAIHAYLTSLASEASAAR